MFIRAVCEIMYWNKLMLSRQSSKSIVEKQISTKDLFFFPTYVFLLKSFINVECSGIFFMSSQSLSVKYIDKILCCLGSYSQDH